MGLYIFQHPKTKKTIEVFQHMSEPHVYEENGVKWSRVFTNPTASFDIKVDPYNSKDFINKTCNKRGSLGDLFDQSKELSMRREEKEGVDSVKEKYLTDWSKARKGKKSPEQRKREAKEKMKKNVVFDIE